MAHKINFFDLAAGFDEDGAMHPIRTQETDDWEEAKSAALAHIAAEGDAFSANLVPDHTLFTDLVGYLAALNVIPSYLDQHPQEGCWMSGLTDDLDHWAEMEVFTPADLARHLDIEFEREMRKEAMCDW